MIISDTLGNLNPIIFSVILIAYLMLFELGNEKIKHALRPLIIVFILIFMLIAVLDVYATYVGLK